MVKETNRIIILLIFICFCLSSCVTNTVIDALRYPGEFYSAVMPDSAEGLVICIQLESLGYQFDQFPVYESGLEVSYPDGSKQRYLPAYSVRPTIITSINRDTENPNFLNDEIMRLEEQTRTFCEDFQHIATDLESELNLGGVFYWDYINGVRGGFSISESCEIIDSYGWSTGGYGNSYQPNPEAQCPSGHVTN